MHHAYVVESPQEAGKEYVRSFVEKELGIALQGNPDVLEFTYGLLTIEDARTLIRVAQQGALGGKEKILIIAASRLYHESQNALLKVCEEPPPHTFLLLIVPSLGQLLPTLRSRLIVLDLKKEKEKHEIGTEFVRMPPEKRSAFIKKLTSGKDEEDRRAKREEALALVNEVEALVYEQGPKEHRILLSELGRLRDFLYDRSLSVKMILEHLSLVLPKGLK